MSGGYSPASGLATDHFFFCLLGLPNRLNSEALHFSALPADGHVKPSIGHRNGEMQEHAKATRTIDDLFSGHVLAAQPLRGGAVFRWESTAAGVLILAALGCTARPPSVAAHFDQIDQLVPIARPTNVVGYRGCDNDRHYFSLPIGKAYTIPKVDWTVTEMPVELGLCLPLWLEHGRFMIPPRHWAISIDLESLQWALQS
jgi:hypothetical protein